MDCFASLAMTALRKVARAALGDGRTARAFQEEVGAPPPSHGVRGTNAWRRLNANRIRLNMIKITPTIILNSASVAVFGSWTMSGAAVTGAAACFNAAT